MPESLMLTTTEELPVVISHACGKEVCGNHVCCGNSGSLGVTAQRVLRSRDSSDGRARRRATERCCTCDDAVNVLFISIAPVDGSEADLESSAWRNLLRARGGSTRSRAGRALVWRGERYETRRKRRFSTRGGRRPAVRRGARASGPHGHRPRGTGLRLRGGAYET